MTDKLNDHRADHQCFSHGFGTCVKWYVRAYEVSLAMDGSNTCVFYRMDDSLLFEVMGTDLDSIVKTKDFIDAYEKGDVSEYLFVRGRYMTKEEGEWYLQ